MDGMVVRDSEKNKIEGIKSQTTLISNLVKAVNNSKQKSVTEKF